MRRFAAVLSAGALVAGVLTGCGEENWAQKCTTTNGVVECAPDQRPAVAGLTGELLAGGSYDLSQDKGKVVVVNFWGSWCGPCRAEADDLQKAFAATKASGVAFLGVNIRDERDSAKAFERNYGVEYPSIFDHGSKVALEFDVTQTTTPATLVLDREGRIAAAIRRPTVQSELQPLVERIAAEKAS